MSVFAKIQPAMDAAWAMATGQISDTNSAIGRAVGYATAATANVTVAVRASTYAPQAAQAQRSIVSTSASDGGAGTGALTVVITYLDNAMALHTETVTLNGTTAVNTVGTNIQFIESIVVATTGSNLANVGTINLMTGLAGAGSIMAQINVGDNSTFYAHHYVPAGVTCYLLKHTGAGTGAVGRTLMVRTGDPRVTNLPTIQVGDIIIHLAGGTEDHEYRVPLGIVGPDLIILRENPVATAAGNLAYGSFDWLQD
jgi:hypothetical protein